jgi:hypothetical protein
MTVVETHDRVEARVAELMGTINLATAELVALIAGVIEDETWALAAGIRSVEHWVSWQCGVSGGRASGLVAMARRRAELPANTALFDAGQLTEDAMVAIARRAPTERDAEVAEHSSTLLHSQLVRMLTTVPLPEQPADEPARSEVDFGVDGQRWKLRANLSVDEGALVEKALTACRSKVFFERHPDAEEENRCDASVTWLDGLLRAAELALRGLGSDDDGRPADRHQVMLHIDVASQLARLHLSEAVPDSIRRYLSCDSDVRAVLENDGVLVAMSSRLRTVDDRWRAVIEQRDGGCRVPGCRQRRWLHIHHLVHWEDGGPTTSPNLCALCPLHHKLHHLGLIDIRGRPETIDGLRFYDQRGHEIGARAPTPPDQPLQPPPDPYVHPPGAPMSRYWFHWRDLERRRNLN